MPVKMKNCILHATLSTDKFILMASDIVGKKGLQKGNAVSIFIDCNSKDEINNYYKKLPRGGDKRLPVKINFEGSLIGDLIDKFGNNWFLYCSEIN